jgi:hypothetical protein
MRDGFFGLCALERARVVARALGGDRDRDERLPARVGGALLSDAWFGGQPAFAVFVEGASAGPPEPFAVEVLRIEDGLIADIDHFLQPELLHCPAGEIGGAALVSARVALSGPRLMWKLNRSKEADVPRQR